MDFKRIIETGYGKLAEKLSDRDKGVLEGYKFAMEDLKTFKENLDDYIDSDVEMIAAVEKQIAELAIENAIEWLDSQHDETLVSFVDNNNYEIDENGRIYPVDDEGNEIVEGDNNE